MNISMKNFEYIFNTTVNQIIFTNALGEFEYHPERLDFVLDYFYLKYFEEYEFKYDNDFDSDIFSLEFYEKLSEEIESALSDDVKKRRFNNRQYSVLEDAITEKIEFEKNSYYKRSNYSITDAYLGELLTKISDWLEDKGIEKFLEVVSKTGEELGKDKKLQ